MKTPTIWALPVNLLEYINKEFGGNQSAFAKAQKVKPQQVTRWINDEFIVNDGYLYSPRRKLKGRDDLSNAVPGEIWLSPEEQRRYVIFGLYEGHVLAMPEVAGSEGGMRPTEGGAMHINFDEKGWTKT